MSDRIMTPSPEQVVTLAAALGVPVSRERASHALSAVADLRDPVELADQLGERLGLGLSCMELPLEAVPDHGALAGFVCSSGGVVVVARSAPSAPLRRIDPGVGGSGVALDLPSLVDALGLESQRAVVRVFAAQVRFPAATASGNTTPHRRLLALLRLEWRALSPVLVYAVAVGCLALATPIALQVLITWLTFGALLQPVLVLSAFLLVALTAWAVLRGLQRFAVEWVQRRIFARLVEDIGARLERARLDAFDRRSASELVHRVFEIPTMQKAASSLLVDGSAAVLQAAVGLGLLAFYHPALLAFDILLIAGFALVLGRLGRGATERAIRESKSKYETAAWLQQVAIQPLAVKLGATGTVRQQVTEHTRDYLTERSGHFRLFMRQLTGALALYVVASVGLLVLCGWLVLEGQLSVGQLVAAEFVVTAALSGLVKLVDKLETWYDLLAGVDKLGALLDLPLDETKGRVPDRSGEAVALHFSCLDLGDGPVSFNVPAGSHRVLAVAREEREGMAETLCGLRPAERGQVTRDAIDQSELQPRRLHEESALLRDVPLVAASIRLNLALGAGAMSDERTWAALGAVGIADDIARLPDGLDSQVGPWPGALSERVRLGLLAARVLLSRPRLCVVDDFFSTAPELRKPVLRFLAGRCTVLELVTRESSARPVAREEAA